MIENFAFQALNKPYDYIELDYAAVSILVYKNKEILFIKRSDNMPTHKGHIAFPGGKKELSDSSVVSTAVREASEELLISENLIKPVGILEPIDTVEYKFLVFPILCSLSIKPKQFNTSEVQKVIYEPIRHLMNKDNWSFRGAYSDDWIYMLGDEILWGATAKMIRLLLKLKLV
mgnify:FL=1